MEVVKMSNSMKVLVGEGAYKQAREVEKLHGKKLKDLFMIVPDVIDGVAGVYRVIRCYKGVNEYWAEMELIEQADSLEEAVLKMDFFA